ncbi:magnesium-translocating P-type ATPase [Streptomyces sp. ATexAB-D23]|uniref:magnesium-translocating P-type ATPase n=1 Tax=unclassified Streptomyces TaxID=2593676 RepID=UPI001F1D48D3|nr:magnesium-translocating P-type ATPase [Streptomyces sp. ATexAB-D23]
MARPAGPLPPPGPVDHGLTPLQVLRTLHTSPRGLTEDDAAVRLGLHGPNTLPASRATRWPVRLARAARDPFTGVLLVLGLVSATVASWGTATVIVTLVAVSCALRAHGEHRAERAMARLRDLVATTVSVQRRSGPESRPRVREVPAGDVVPGDVVRLGPGDLVPADVRLLRAHHLAVDQSALTGESAPVPKEAHDPPDGNDMSFAREDLCFQGSTVITGSAVGVVVATGAHTRFATAHLPAGPRPPSAFDRSVHGIAWVLIRFMLLTPPLVLMANAALRGRGLETLPFAVAVAVGLTPEMLPVVVTTCLTRGAALLARTREVIVRRPQALHNLGAMDVLCLDKTGTLTQDRPQVLDAVDAEGSPAPDVLAWATVNAWWTLQLADLPTPDALDAALLDTGDPDDALAYEPVAALPFDSTRRLSTAVVHAPDALGRHILVAKGAVESVLERCALGEAERAKLLGDAARLAATGVRLLAVATAEREARHRPYRPADERGLAFRGFVTFRDALAPSAAEALARFAGHGVAVRILTGDHPATTARACRDLGLEPGDVADARSLDALDDGGLADLADHTTVFARCGPEDKARVVAALRERGHTVGFLGDGVNDLPALHAADVGICPVSGVGVARESADVVLADKNLTAIDDAITTGRHAGGNIASYLRITLSSNLGNVIAMLTAGVLLPFLPMLPAQVLVQNLCFDAAQLALAHDRPAPGLLARPVVLRPAPFLRTITGFGLLGAGADLATFATLAATASAAHDQGAFHSGWFTENLLTQALVMLLLRTGSRPAPRPLRVAAAALAAVGVTLPLTALGARFGLEPLPMSYYLLLTAVLTGYAAALAFLTRRGRAGRSPVHAD